MKGLVAAIAVGLVIGWTLFFAGTLVHKPAATDLTDPRQSYGSGCGETKYAFDWFTGKEWAEWTRHPRCMPVIPEGAPRLGVEGWMAHETGAMSVPVPVGFLVGAAAVLALLERRYRRTGEEWL